jgi:hypothetical protein
MSRARFGIALLSLIGAAAFVSCPSLSCGAITAGHVDDFQDGTTQHWRIGQPSDFPKVVADAGPQGAGDFALFSTNAQVGSRSLLVVLNESSDGFPGPGNWESSWTAAGVTQISLDVRNPGVVEGASDLTMRLGIAGTGGVSGGGGGDVFITDGITVPPDNAWHSITFDVQPADFIAVGSETDIDAALADVTQFRIFSNPVEEFRASGAPNEFYLDNIRAIGSVVTVDGDYNADGSVDAADYVVWRDMSNQSVPPGSGADGTGPNGAPDGIVDALDYDFWRARFGDTGSAAATGPAPVEVPEPAAWLLMLGFSLAVGVPTSRQKRLDRRIGLLFVRT